jgi:hypothetical protein
MKVIDIEPSEYHAAEIYSDTAISRFGDDPRIILSVGSDKNKEICGVYVQQEVSYIQSPFLLEKKKIEQSVENISIFFSAVFLLSLIHIVVNFIYFTIKKGISISFNNVVVNFLILVVYIAPLMIIGPRTGLGVSPCLPSDEIIKVKTQAELIGIVGGELTQFGWSIFLSITALILMSVREYFVLFSRDN